MRLAPILGCLLLLLAPEISLADTLFRDRFHGRLGAGWFWLRENRAGWRIDGNGLFVRVEPGNMWGGANNARNVLVRLAPEPRRAELEVTATVENRPTEQYEQADLVWYYDDSNMVKVGQEMVDGRLSIVMGREEADRTRTIAIIPLHATQVRLRFRVKNNEIEGAFRTPGDPAWRIAGKCDLPAARSAPKISLQFYQGPAQTEHWARVTDFQINRR